MKNDAPAVPVPPPPKRRKEPLPWENPKSAEDDPGAPARLAAILASGSYRRADEDTQFLAREEARGTRLQLDYLKAEALLVQAGIQHTVVVFGGTRILESIAAAHRVRALEQALADSTASAEIRQRLAAAKRILAKSEYYDIARDFGHIVGQYRSAIGKRLAIVTGGGPGIMEAANRGSFDCGAPSVGLNIHLPQKQFPNPYITPHLCFLFHYFAIRKLHFLRRARALVAFPGGYGTFDELFEALSLVQTRKIKPLPIILVGKHYWQHAFNVAFLLDEGVIDPEDAELFWFAETAQDIWQGILDWYEKADEPLFGVTAT